MNEVLKNALKIILYFVLGIFVFSFLLFLLTAIDTPSALFKKHLRNESLLTTEERITLQRAFDQINTSLPRPMGSLLYFTKISLEGDTIVYDYEVRKFDNFGKICEIHPDEVKSNLMHMFVVMNGRSEFGNKLASLMKEKGLNMKVRFAISSELVYEVDIEGIELAETLRKIELSPTEAYAVLIQNLVFFARKNIALNIDSYGSVTSIPARAIQAATPNGEDLLVDIGSSPSGVYFKYLITDSIGLIETIRNGKQNPVFLKNFTELISEDEDMRELLTTIALAKMSYTVTYINKDTLCDSVKFTIPNHILEVVVPPCYSSILKR